MHTNMVNYCNSNNFNFVALKEVGILAAYGDTFYLVLY